MILRTEVLFWLNQCDLKWDQLIYLDDLLNNNTNAKIHKNQVSLILVDHQTLTMPLKQTNWTVVEIIDHHAPSEQVNCEHLKLKLIELVGSCASLITLEILKNMDGFKLPVTLWKLLYGAILLDTIGLSTIGHECGRLTDLDLRMANRIEDMISLDLFGSYGSREQLFKQLEEAKFITDGLSSWDLLRRDLKVAVDPLCELNRIVCSTISGLDFEDLLRLPDFDEAAKRICQIHSTNLLVCITVAYSPNAQKSSELSTSLTNQGRRSLIIYYNNYSTHELSNRLSQFLLDPSHQLDLLPIKTKDSLYFTAVVQNKKITRKTILPLLVNFLRSTDGPTKFMYGNRSHSRTNSPSSKETTSVTVTPSATVAVEKNNSNLKSSNESGSNQFSTSSSSEVGPIKNGLPALYNWLLPLRHRERCEFLRLSRNSDSVNATSDENCTSNSIPSLDFINYLWLSLWRGVNNTSKPICTSVSGRKFLVKSVCEPQNRRSASVIHSKINSSRLKWEPKLVMNLDEAFTVPNIQSSWTVPSGQVRSTIPRILRHCHKSDNHLFNKDSDTEKPDWLETENSGHTPTWLSAHFTTPPLDSPETLSFHLYRRLSSVPLHGHVTADSETAHKPNAIFLKDNDVESIFFRNSMKRISLDYANKRTSTSGLPTLCGTMINTFSSVSPNSVEETTQFRPSEKVTPHTMRSTKSGESLES